MPCKNWQNNNYYLQLSQTFKGAVFFICVFTGLWSLLSITSSLLLQGAYIYTYSKFHCVIATKMTGILLCPAVFFTAVPLSHPDAWPEQLWGRQAPLCPILHINNYMYFGYFHSGLYMWLWYAEQPNFVCIFISFRLNTQPDVIFASPVEQPLRAAHSLRSVDPAARWIQPSTIIKQKKTS